jgi:uncharacterized membrane protein
MPKTITAVFNTREEYESALRRLEQEGIMQDQVTLLISEEGRARHFGLVESTKTPEGAVAGATVGGLLGALYLGLASAGTILIPGLNLVASGALIGSLAGLGAGAAAGGFVGALVGLGIPEHEAKLYEEKLRGGCMLLAVETRSDAVADKVRTILESSNAQSVTAMAA